MLRKLGLRDELTPGDAAAVLRAAAATAAGRALGPNELRAAVAALQQAAGIAGAGGGRPRARTLISCQPLCP